MIKTFVGPMHSTKTASLMCVYNKIWNKDHILCFKPKRDTRDKGIIKSKDFEETLPAISIVKFEEILKYVNGKVRTIFIDEAQMLEGDINVLTYLSIGKDIDIYIAGLNMTSEQQPFAIMPFIMAISDEVEVLKASCYDCGREASYTFYEGVKDEVILVGDSGYMPLCKHCLLKRRGKRKLKNSLLKK